MQGKSKQKIDDGQFVGEHTAADPSSKRPLEVNVQGGSISKRRPILDPQVVWKSTHGSDRDTMKLIYEESTSMKNDANLRLLDDGDTTVDRISNLPRELITSILGSLPLQEVARTSILSKAWRNIWSMHPYIYFDWRFHSHIIIHKKGSDAYASTISRVLDMILLVHSGPITVFCLYIPPTLYNPNMYQWIEKLSSKGVQTIQIGFSKQSGEMLYTPFFNCADLTRLRLRKWILSPPLKPRTFSSLIHVRLEDTLISRHMSFGTQLQTLELLNCSHIEHLGFQFTKGNNLRRLLICASTTIQRRWFECTTKLEYLELTTTHINEMKVISLVMLIRKIPSLHTLNLDGRTLMILGPAASIHTTTAVNLKILLLNRIELYNLCQISNSVSLIRSFPNLRYLCIILSLNTTTESTIERYLGSIDRNQLILEKLETVVISGVDGSRYVINFIKLLLASSRSLKVMFLLYNSKVKYVKELLRIKQELQQFPRLCPEAKLVWKQKVVRDMMVPDMCLLL